MTTSSTRAISGPVALGGAGDDLYLGGAGGDGPAGDQGDDWLEGGVGVDALSGDSGAPFGIDINTPGDDVLIGGSSADALDGGGGVDIGVDADNLAVVDEFLGGLGFDWYSYDGSTQNADSDLGNFAPANPPGTIPAAFQDSFIDVEALSGGAGNDILRGDDRATLDTVTPGASDALVSGDLAKVQGLPTLLGSATSWSSGNILVGGAGDDTLEGGGWQRPDRRRCHPARPAVRPHRGRPGRRRQPERGPYGPAQQHDESVQHRHRAHPRAWHRGQRRGGVHRGHLQVQGDGELPAS